MEEHIFSWISEKYKFKIWNQEHTKKRIKEMSNKECVMKYLKIILKLRYTIGQKLMGVFFFIFTKGKTAELILNLKHLN